MELKPCPFCGSTNGNVRKPYERFTLYRLTCPCGAEGADKGSEEQAIKAWNTRTPPKENK